MKTNNIQQYITALFSRYEYRSDRKNRDRWSVLARIDDIFGDCEDWCLTLLRDIYGPVGMWIALARGVARMHYCTINKAGHAVVEIGGLIYDCNNSKGWRWNDKQIKRRGYKYGHDYSVNRIVMKVYGQLGYAAIWAALAVALYIPAWLITYKLY